MFQSTRTDEHFVQLRTLEESQIEMKRRNQALRGSCKAALKNHKLDNVIPLVCPLLERAADVANVEAENLEQRERAEAELHEVPFVPSETLNALKGRVSNLRDRATSLRTSVGYSETAKELLKDVLDF